MTPGRPPLFVLMLGVLSALMMVPSALAALQADWATGRGFLYAALFCAVTAGVLGLAVGRPRVTGMRARDEVFALVLVWAGLPVFAALPLMLVTPEIGWQGAVFEMVAAFTTTGGTVYGAPERLPDALHLWRATVAWLGGFVTLTAAWTVLAPRRLGGFEIEAATWRRQEQTGMADHVLGVAPAPLGLRLKRAVRVILPIYLTLTGGLVLLFEATGQSGLDSTVHAMSILSTSGISAHSDGFGAAATPLAEVLAALFLLTAATRSLYANASPHGTRVSPLQDPELRTMAVLAGLVTAGLFLRHWVGALTIELGPDVRGMGEALWGTFFTVLSFLTTTGFESAYWEAARDWSGLANPGLILLGLAAIGGGAATTAGGIKLIRAYALFRHGRREIERIAEPYSIIGVGAHTRSLLREGPIIVWSFVMLFIFAILGAVLGLTALGLDFQTAMVAAIAAIANCGPAFEMVMQTGRNFADLLPEQRAVLMIAMVVGRIETLALIALLNPEAWRRSFRQQRGGKRRSGRPQ